MRVGDKVWYGSICGTLNGISPSGLAFVTFGDVTIPFKVLEGFERSLPAEMCCSFCSKWRNEVRKLVAGKSAYICDECVRVCQVLVDEKIESTVEAQGAS